MSEERRRSMDNDLTHSLEEVLGHPLRRSTDTNTLTDLSVRLGKVEESIVSTTRNLDKLASSMNDNVSRLTRNLEDINKTQLMGSKTNWGMLASWAGVFVVLLGLVVYQPLQELRGEIQTHLKDGHPASVISKIDDLRTGSLNHWRRSVKRQDRVDKWILDTEGRVRTLSSEQKLQHGHVDK